MAKGWHTLTKKAGFLVILCLFLPSIMALEQNNSKDRTKYYTNGGIYYTDLIGDHLTLDGGAATRNLALSSGGWTIDAGTPTYEPYAFYPGFENMTMNIKGASDTFYIKVAATNDTFLGSIGMTVVPHKFVTLFTFYTHLKSNDGTNMLMYCKDFGTKSYWTPDGINNCSTVTQCELDKAYNITWVYNASNVVRSYVNERDCGAWAENGFTGGATNTIWISDSAGKAINFSIFDFYIANSQRRPTAPPVIDPEPAATIVKDSGNYSYKGGCSYNGATGTNTTTTQYFYFVINASYTTAPNSTAKNNTLGQNITVQCNTPGNATIYFGTVANPVTPVSGGGTNYTTLIINASTVPADGVYYYKGACGKINGLFGSNTTTYTFIYDTGEPEVTVNANNFFKATNYSTSNQYNNSNLLLNLTFIDNIDLFAFSVNITRAGTSYYSYQNESLTGTTWNFSASVNQTTWASDFEYLIDVYVSDSHTDTIIAQEDYIIDKLPSELKFKTTDNNIRLVSKEPSIVNTNYNTDRFAFSFDYTKDKDYNPTLTTRTYDIYSDKPMYKRTSKYKGHIVMGDAKGGNWVDFEGMDADSVIITEITPYHFKVTVNLKKAAGVVAFQSIGGLNVGHYTYKYYKGKVTPTAVTGVVSLPFTISIQLTRNTTIKNITADFSYNNTANNNITVTDTGGYFDFSITLPGFTLDSDQNFNYTWNLNVTQQDNTFYRFAYTGEHSIYNLILDNCSIGLMPTAYFNIYNELDVLSRLDTEVELIGTYWTLKGSDDKNITFTRESINNFTLCIYPNGSVIYSDVYIKYTTPTGFTHRYYLVNESLTNSSKTFSLYNFNTTTGISDLKITLRRNSDYSYYQNVVAKLLKRYVSENIWRVVQMDESGDYGLVFFNIQEENQDYRLVYMDRYNNVLYSSETLKFICTTGICDLTQKLSPYAKSAAALNTSIKIYYSNATGMLNLTWSKPSGLSVSQEIYITKNSPSGSQLLYNVNQTGAAGQISFNASLESGDLIVSVWEDGTKIKSATIVTDSDKLFSYLDQTEAAFYTFGIMLTCIMFGLLSPVGVIITTMLGLIMIYLLGIFSPITFTFILIAGIMGIAIGIKVRT